ncbi:hypothetical protein H9P43_006576 [Blastocladiella emersonii ATCC 22665]|nr:hypothetical protein H9P43_006576 [Blastocladiella emersonii ATCC 22665]
MFKRSGNAARSRNIRRKADAPDADGDAPIPPTLDAGATASPLHASDAADTPSNAAAAAALADPTLPADADADADPTEAPAGKPLIRRRRGPTAATSSIEEAADDDDAAAAPVIPIKRSSTAKRVAARAGGVFATSARAPITASSARADVGARDTASPAPAPPTAATAIVVEPAAAAGADSTPHDPFASRRQRLADQFAVHTSNSLTPRPTAAAVADDYISIIDLSRPASTGHGLVVDASDAFAGPLATLPDAAASARDDDDEDEDEERDREEAELRQWELDQIRRGGALAGTGASIGIRSTSVAAAMHDIAREADLRLPHFAPVPPVADALAAADRLVATMHAHVAADADAVALLERELAALLDADAAADEDIHALSLQAAAAAELRDYVQDLIEWHVDIDPVLADLEAAWTAPAAAAEPDLAARLATDVAAALDDVRDDLRDLSTVLARLARYKAAHPDEYRRGRVADVVPLAVAPHVRADLVAWDPLNPAVTSAGGWWSLADRAWHAPAEAYGHTGDVATQNPNDPDLLLYARLVANHVVPAFLARLRAAASPATWAAIPHLAARLDTVLEDIACVTTPDPRRAGPFQVLVSAIVDQTLDAVSDAAPAPAAGAVEMVKVVQLVRRYLPPESIALTIAPLRAAALAHLASAISAGIGEAEHVDVARTVERLVDGSLLPSSAASAATAPPRVPEPVVEYGPAARPGSQPAPAPAAPKLRAPADPALMQVVDAVLGSDLPLSDAQRSKLLAWHELRS